MNTRRLMRMVVFMFATGVVASCATTAGDAPNTISSAKRDIPSQVSVSALNQTLTTKIGGEWKSNQNGVYTSPKKGWPREGQT